ncbi:MAG: hypothetical protein ACYC3I_22685 [Gemmataceae bacterium]
MTGQTLILPHDVAQSLPDANWHLLTNYNQHNSQPLAAHVAAAVQAAQQQGSCPIVTDHLPDEPLACNVAKYAALQIGSPEFCDALEGITKAFSELGHKLIAMLVMFDGLGGTNCKAQASGKQDNYQCPLDGDIGALIGQGVVEGAFSFGGFIASILGSHWTLDMLKSALGINLILPIVKGTAYGSMQGMGFDKKTSCDVATALDPSFLLKYLRETMCTVFQGMSQCTVCNPVLLSGLVFVKGMLGFLKHLRGDFVAGLEFIGKAGIKFAFHLPIEFGPLEKMVNYLIEFSCPTKLPSEGEIRELALRQEITPQHYHTLTKLGGLSPWFSDKTLHAKREKLSHHDVIEWFKRHPKLHDDTDGKLAQMGFIDQPFQGESFPFASAFRE